MFAKKFKWNYSYKKLQPGERIYDDYDFTQTHIVEAQYSHSVLDIDKGNPFIEALPTPRTYDEVDMAYVRPLTGFSRKKIEKLSYEELIRSVSMLRQLRVTLPFHHKLENTFYETLVQSYRKRYIMHNPRTEIPVTINQKEVYLHTKTYSDEGDAANTGFSLIGYSGCGKSSALKILLSHYPQVIFHYPEKGYQIPQIVYLVVNCRPNSNFNALYQSIGTAIDRALGNLTPVYEKMFDNKKSIGEKTNKLAQLIETFSIGTIIFDEIQLIDFSANKDSSYESLLSLCNITKVAISIVGTEDARDKMFKLLRTARRTGVEIDARQYCVDRFYFDYIVTSLFQYQWFKKEIEATKAIQDCLYRFSKGIIDQLIGIYMFMQLEYIQAKKDVQITPAFIEKVVDRNYPGMKRLLEELDTDTIEEQRAKLAREANKKFDTIIANVEQKKISQQLVKNDNFDKKMLRNNIIINIQKVFDNYSEEAIILAFNKVINLKANKDKDERQLTQLTMKKLMEAPKEDTLVKKTNKQTPNISTIEMKEYIKN